MNGHLNMVSPPDIGTLVHKFIVFWSFQTKLPNNEDLQIFTPRNIIDTFKDYKTTDNKARNSKNTRLVLEMKWHFTKYPAQ